MQSGRGRTRLQSGVACVHSGADGGACVCVCVCGKGHARLRCDLVGGSCTDGLMAFGLAPPLSRTSHIMMVWMSLTT